MRPNVEYGDREIALPNEILRSVVGSGVHGIAIEGTDDHDEMGVYIEPPEYVVGLRPGLPHYIWRTQPEGARSGPGDTDLIVRTPLGDELRGLSDAFLSEQAVQRFLGYMHAQHERMLGGGRRSRVPNRPELVVQHGWDTKFGSHALRLAYQGQEIATHGRLTLPLPPVERERVRAVKRGEIPRDEVSAEITSIEHRVRDLLADGGTPLPQRSDLERISGWALDAQRRHWGWIR